MSGQKRSLESMLNVSKVENDPSAVVGTFFNGFKASEDTKFQLYKQKHGSDFALHGENERLEYDGTTEEDSNQYFVAVYDPKAKSLDLYNTPVVETSILAKSKKKLRGPAVKQTNVRANVQRNALGEAFGTKKAKKAIADLERNRVDASKLKDAELDIVDAVKTSSVHLPTREELAKSHDRPTPVANVEATDVEDIYPVHNIIPKKEFSFIRVGGILKETDTKQRLELFPYKNSAYVEKHLPVFQHANQTEKLQMLYYLSLLIGVYENRRVSSKEKLLERLESPPDVLIDGILDRFTIVKPGAFGRSKDRSFVIDPQNEDKLLCYILALVMHIDSFMVEVSPLAQELSLKPSRLAGLLKTLGATIKPATVAQAEAFGIPKSAASTYKVATLKVPFKLPEMTRRGRRA